MVSRIDDYVDPTELNDDDDDGCTVTFSENVIGFGGCLRAVQSTDSRMSLSTEWHDLSSDDQHAVESGVWSIVLEYSAFDLSAEHLCLLCAKKGIDDACWESDPGFGAVAATPSIEESAHESSDADAISVSMRESSDANAISVSVRESSDGSAQSVHAFGANSNNGSPGYIPSQVIASAHENAAVGPEVMSVRAVTKVQPIILDSGADCSALPMSYAHVGVPDVEATAGLFVDAQGNPLRTAGIRIAEIQIGRLRFRERFVISDVVQPLVSLGKLYRAGWFVAPQGDGLFLTDGNQSERVGFRKQSLCVHGTIRVVTECGSINAVMNVALKDPLLRLSNRWTRINSGMYAVKTFSKTFIDTTLLPLSELLWKRTTLVRRGGQWSLIECNADISVMSDRTASFEDADSVEYVITIAHSKGNPSPSEMCFEVLSLDDSLEGAEACASGPPESLEGAPASENPEHSELPVEQRDELMPPESIEVDGVIIDSDSSLEVMRNACKALGLPENGNKAQIFKRLGKHCIEHELLQSKHVSHTLKTEFEREPRSQSTAEGPSEEERAQHELTHEPYRPWCATCVAHRARQDQHASVADHEGSSAATISIDYGFLSRSGESDRNKLTVLFAHDRHSKAVCAIPTPRKGGQAALSFMTTELSRFILWLGYPEIRLRSDNENSVVAVVDSVRKVLRNLGVEVHKDSVPIDAHQANGPVEQALQSVRQLACTLMSQLEVGLGADPGRVLFDTNHPMWQWAICHAAWIKSRFAVTQGSTAYERLTGCLYRGKVCKFGEAVMAYLKQSPKAAPKWQKAVWLGKTVANDVNILGVPGGVFVSRSVRRFSDCWDQKLSAEIDTNVWQHGLASLGGTLVLNNKKFAPAVQPALPLPVEAGKPGGEVIDEAPKSPSQVAASDPVSSGSSSASMSLDFSQGVPDQEMQEQVEDAPEASQTMQHGDQGDASMPSVPDPVQLSENPKPAKQPRIEASISMISATGVNTALDEVNLVVPCEELPCTVEIRKVTYTHEDESVELAFDQDTIDDMESYEYNDYHDDQIGDTGDLDPRLCRPRLFDEEPECTEEEMRELDVIADQVEIARLKTMTVLQDPSAINMAEAVHLTTKMVRTWRPKEVGNPPVPVWYRRSRYVAREFAWLSERTDLFSPASSSLCNRLLPILYMHYKARDDDANIPDDDKLTLFAVDIGDAFLTVPQVRPTYVTYVHADGSKEIFSLGFVLPGQRSGSSDWYDDFMKFLKGNLGVVECAAHPSLVKSTDTESRFAMQLHVDDMLGFAKRKYVHEVFIPTLKTKYKVTAHVIENIGDSITFLKRKHTLLSSDQLLLTPSPKHFDKLFDLLAVSENASFKKSPYMPQLDEVDSSPELKSSEATAFRSGIGLLLYLSVDLPECQCAIRALASRMARPTVQSMLALRHLAKYLIGVRYNGLMIVKTDPGEGLMGPRNDAGDQSIVLESFSDSNWAACKGSRKSVSASVICVAGNMLFSSSRTQRVVALSSGEAELLSSASSICDALLIRELLEFMDFGRVKIFHHIDASAAKAMLERSGVGKVRHLSCRILWCQQLIKSGEVALLKISTTFNPSDLGTKGLSRARTLMLMCILRVWDEMHECFVGAQELKEEREKQSFKQNMQVLRNIRVPIMISKNALRAMVAASMFQVSSALSFGSGLELFAAVYALMFEEFPMMTLMMLYLFTLAVIGTIMCMRSQPIVIVKGFDKSLCDDERTIDISSRSSSKDSNSTSVTGEEVMIKQRRKRRVKEPVNPVWVAGEYGKKYHMIGCGKLNGSLEVYHPEEFTTKPKAK